MTGHIDWFLAASEEASGLKDRLPVMVDDHLLDVGATNTCLTLACIHEHLPNIDLAPTVSEGFAGAPKTTEELYELADSYMPAIRSLLWSVQFDSLPYIFGSHVY